MSSARFAQCYLCSLEVLRGVSHGATEVGAGGRGRRSPFHQQQRRTGICLQLALDLPDGIMAATMTTNKPPQNPSRRGQSELIPLTQQECADCRRRLRFLESLRCRSACLALFLVGLCSMGPLSRAAQAENIALQNPSFRAVFDRVTGALREIKGDQWLASFGAPGGRLMAEDFPGGSAKELTAQSCRLSDQRCHARNGWVSPSCPTAAL